MFSVLLENGIGKSLEDLTINYTVDQVYLFYEKRNKIQLDSYKMSAVIAAQALIYASPSYSQGDSSKKQQQWKKFMDSLEWERIEAKNSQGPNDSLKGLMSLALLNKKGDS